MSSLESKRTSQKVNLTEDDIIFIMANTDFTRAKIIEWHAQFIKQCPLGKINRKEFVQFYKQLTPGNDNNIDEDRFCEYVFKAFDSDNNGYVDFAEFLQSFWIRAKGNLREKLSWLFSVYDSDSNNFITYWELGHMLRLLFNMKNIKGDPYEKAKEIFSKIDRSNDYRLTKQEFIAGCTKDEQIRQLFAPF